MFFFLSKTLWFFLDPGNILLLALVAGALLTWSPWKRLTRWWLTATAVYALFMAMVPLGHVMFEKLESRIPQQQALPAEVDGLIVMGGVVDQFISQERNTVSLNGAVERLTAFADLAKRYPNAKLVFTGGSGVLFDQALKEAHFVKPFLVKLGLDTNRVIFEDRSRNTAENAVFTKKLVNPQPSETWMVITSAFHMPRTLGAFRQQAWSVVPYTVDYHLRRNQSLGLRFNLRSGLNTFATALREWTGLTFYWLSGRTNEWFPGPDSNSSATGT